MSDRDRTRWDERHRRAGVAGLDEVGPPHRFRPHEELFPAAGRALELACGRGHHAVWLARRGLEVWGVDVSPVAVAQASELAAAAGVAERCTFDVVDLDAGLPAGPPVGVLLCHRFRDPRLDDAIVGRLAPGGLLAIVVLSEVGAGPGPFRAAAGELTAAFTALDVLVAGEHAGEAWLLARRPALLGAETRQI